MPASPSAEAQLSEILSPERGAVVTGAASGIGLAAAKRFAALGMHVCLADLDETALDTAHEEVRAAAQAGRVMSMAVDVADPGAMAALRDRVQDTFGGVALLMNNAVARHSGGCLDEPDNWRKTLDVGLFGVINGCQAFAPDMIAAGAPAMIVNVGSKQGITNPPGRPHYNVAKAAVKAYTELLQHELRSGGGAVTTHLLIPGMTTTGGRDHRPGAWWPDQVVDFMLEALERGDFYILCPDGEVTPEMDAKRILWAARDITENRPPLTRWHPSFKAAFDAFEP
ncbi:MAG TPA: short-chain dehydrogenase [Rhodospirillaceae bacterium]|nr:short-chain dehydrogenase [Magnetovibrio sp.]HCS69610.1 short-chain dehydrogenase [Rhodospirillaceae bacterium]|tara:strand:+ start:72 stop:920 length:849 start_codon:yes stop_codon:yes gene_type:complete